MKGCACHWVEVSGGLTKEFTLCDLHAREFAKRLAEMPMPIKIWNDALDAAEGKLVARSNLSPTDKWIAETLAGLRRKQSHEPR
jgi:hypothetical protein